VATRTEAIRLLIGAKANVQYANQRPLRHAVTRSDCTVCAALLLDAKADATVGHHELVLEAVKNQNLAMVRLLERHGARLLRRSNACLLAAAREGFETLVIELLRRGTDAAASNSQCLFAALGGGLRVHYYSHLKRTARLLVLNGANPDAVDTLHQTPLGRSARCARGGLRARVCPAARTRSGPISVAPGLQSSTRRPAVVPTRLIVGCNVDCSRLCGVMVSPTVASRHVSAVATSGDVDRWRLPLLLCVLKSASK